jgi:hypothetical protein
MNSLSRNRHERFPRKPLDERNELIAISTVSSSATIREELSLVRHRQPVLEGPAM